MNPTPPMPSARRHRLNLTLLALIDVLTTTLTVCGEISTLPSSPKHRTSDAYQRVLQWLHPVRSH